MSLEGTNPQIFAVIGNGDDLAHFFLKDLGNQVERLPSDIVSLTYAEGSHFFEKRTALREFVSEEVAKTIEEYLKSARVDMSVLINSLGGYRLVANRVMKIAEALKKRGGSVTSYVANNVQSTAAEIFAVSDVRHAVQDTNFMWHLSSTETQALHNISTTFDLETVLRYERDMAFEHWTEIRTFLEQSCHADFLQALKDRLDAIEVDQNNKDRQVRLSGAELYQMGIVHKVHLDIGSLREQFEEDTKLLLDQRKDTTSLESFFIFSRIERQFYRKTGRKIYLFVDPQDGLLKYFEEGKIYTFPKTS